MTTTEERRKIVSLLKDCVRKKDLQKGIILHSHILKRGLLSQDCYIASTLVHMYANCGELAKAAKIVDKLTSRSVVPWNALITGYKHHGEGREALKCFEKMQYIGISPDAVTFTSALGACGSICSCNMGEQIYVRLVNQGLLGKDIVLDTALVDMYAKCGALGKAAKILDDLPLRDVVTWNALLSGYLQQGHIEEAFKYFVKMQNEGVSPNSITFISILQACGTIRASGRGKQIHEELVRQGLLEKDIMVGTALVDMYAKCGALSIAAQVFDEILVRNVICYNALITGYAQQGHGNEVLLCFELMQWEGLSPDTVTFVCILKACGDMEAMEKGEEIHNQLQIKGLLGKDNVIGNALVDMYAKCGVLEKASQVLEELSMQNVVSWNALITGYIQQEEAEEALKCFERMLSYGHYPDTITYTCILNAYASLGALHMGERIHEEICKHGLLKKNIGLANALVDMYAKCGALRKAAQVIDELPIRNVVSWSALIAGYAQHGESNMVQYFLEQMQWEGLTPNAVTFSSLLSACSHTGVTDGQLYLENGSSKYDIDINAKHYTSLVDAFSRSGDFEKAVTLLSKMPSDNSLPGWVALLGGCWEWGNMMLGKSAFDNAIAVQKDCASAYILLAKLYADAGIQEVSENIEAMKET